MGIVVCAPTDKGYDFIACDGWHLVTIMALVGAFIAAVAAIAASKASEVFSSRRLEANCVRALAVEIRRLTAAVSAGANEELVADFVRISFLTYPDSICPIYMGVTHNIGLLHSEAILSIVDFYSTIITVKPIKVNNQNVNDAFSKKDLEIMAEKGNTAIRVIEKIYNNKLT